MTHLLPVADVPSPTTSGALRARATTVPLGSGGPCEFVWTCTRGRTQLCCQLDVHGDGQHRLTLLRNSRTYGQYEFCGRDAALTFAARLRSTFEGNGWANA